MHIINAKLVTPKYAIELFGLFSATHMLPYQAPGNLCRGVCVKQSKKQGTFVCEKMNTEDGLCSLKSDGYIECNLTDYDTTTQAIFRARGRGLRKKALYMFQIEFLVYKKSFGPPVARLRCLCFREKASLKGAIPGYL